MIGVKQMDHLNMGVRNIAETEKFYLDLFGFEEKERGIGKDGEPFAILDPLGTDEIGEGSRLHKEKGSPWKKKASAERDDREIRRKTRRRFSAEVKARPALLPCSGGAHRLTLA